MKTFMCVICTVAASGILATGGCSTVPKNGEALDVLSAEVDQAVAVFKNKDPEIQRFFDESYGYAVFPKVIKGAFWVGGAFGRGEVYEQNSLAGYSSLSQATLGFSFGGEYFREIIFFRDQSHFNQFITGDYTFSAQATAVALTAGAARKADYQDGKAVFIIAESGLMVDASIGGQKFEFSPLSVVREN